MTKLNFSKEEFTPTLKFLVRGFNKKKGQALLKLNSFREKFEKQKEEIETDLEEAGKTWKGVSKRFAWWQKQELP